MHSVIFFLQDMAGGVAGFNETASKELDMISKEIEELKRSVVNVMWKQFIVSWGKFKFYLAFYRVKL